MTLQRLVQVPDGADDDRPPRPPPPDDRHDQARKQEPDGIRLVTASTVHPQPVHWAWAPRIPLGAATLLVGVPGLGKSTLAVELAARASRGQLDGDLDVADVLFATAEDDIGRVLVPRLLAAGADLDRVHFVTMWRDGLEDGLVLPDDLPALRGAVDERDARLVVVDPLASHLAGSIDSHRDHHVRLALAPLARLAQDTNAAVLAIAHLNKSPSADLFTRVGGSIGLTAAARSVLLATPDPEADEDDGAAAVLVHGKSNYGEQATTVRFRVEGRRLDRTPAIHTSAIAWAGDAGHLHAADVLAPADRDEVCERDEAGEFLVSLLADGPVAAAEVWKHARTAGFAERTVKRAKRDRGIASERRGGIASDGAWYWRLPAPEDPNRVTPACGTVSGSAGADHAENGTETAPSTPSGKGATIKGATAGDLLSGDAPCDVCGAPSVATDRTGAEVCADHRTWVTP